MLPLERISVSRIRHPRDRFRVGQQINAAVLHMDRALRRVTLTHRELLGTWEENAGRFSVGETVQGTVSSLRDYGAFIELSPNLSGLAEPNFDLRVGDAVSVYIKSILPERLKIKLVALRKLDAASLPEKPLRYFRTSGHMDRWRYGTESFAKTISVF